MKLIHLSDLHIGKRVHEQSMLEDQKYILEKILEIVDREQPDAVLIAGDLYDRPVPGADAVAVMDSFLSALAARGTAVCAVSGNHDSPERIAFGARLLDLSRVYLSPVYDGSLKKVTLNDAYGNVNIFLLPFLKPAYVRRFFPEEEIRDYTDAVRAALSAADLDPEERNVLVAHQFVTGAERSESEEVSVGGLDNVDASVFQAFDYTALGHIHGPQNMAGGRIRYCGTPLKYSFSEARHVKSVTVVELMEKGAAPEVRTIPLTPLRDMQEIRGTYEELMRRDFYSGMNTENYMHVTLTDEDDVPAAAARLSVVYPNLLKLDYDNRRTREVQEADNAGGTEEKTPAGLFEEFFEKMNNGPMDEEQRRIVSGMIERIWEEES